MGLRRACGSSPLMFGEPVFWRDTMKPAKFLIFDVRAALALFPALMHIRPWTIALAIAVMVVFWWFERKGVPADSILRYLRARLVGPRRTARGAHEERLPVDFGFECRTFLEKSRSETARSWRIRSMTSTMQFERAPAVLPQRPRELSTTGLMQNERL